MRRIIEQRLEAEFYKEDMHPTKDQKERNLIRLLKAGSELGFTRIKLIVVPNIYKPPLRREGILHKIEVLTKRPLKTKPKEKAEGTKSDATKQEPKTEGLSLVPEPASEQDESLWPQPIIPISVKQLSSAVLDPQDAIALHAKAVRFNYLSGAKESTADPVFERLQGLLGTLRDPGAAEAKSKDAMKVIAAMFGTSGGTSILSHELLKSGLVNGLLQFTTDPALTIDVATRQQMPVFLQGWVQSAQGYLVLAAFAAAAGPPAGALSRVAAGSSGAGPSCTSAAAGSSSGLTSAPTVGRRQNHRLKAKNNVAAGDSNTLPTMETSPTSQTLPLNPPLPTLAAATAESMLSALAAGGDPRLLVLGSKDFDMEHAEDMLNEDLEAEFYEADMEPHQGSPKKTASISLNNGMAAWILIAGCY
ncbi:hypothetical protein RSOLAG22IIIB_13412 [Rhizoctonia solani]|uniref:Uncharacterized protein n=1 Tax=Rhizoctonia solani TaxID=456999 RepID=A0A0K6FN19_9AGAM|nr:hypothetical protein RSOLAG22IIIB_13412 [Rhizoctonia solani]